MGIMINIAKDNGKVNIDANYVESFYMEKDGYMEVLTINMVSGKTFYVDKNIAEDVIASLFNAKAGGS